MSILPIRIEPCTDPGPIVEVLGVTLSMEAIDEDRFTRQVLLDPNFREQGSLVAWQGKEPVAYCWAVARHLPLENALDDRDRGYIALFAIKHEAREIGPALLDSAEQYLRTRGCSSCWVSCYVPGYFTPGIDERAYPKDLELFCSSGYEVINRPLGMQLDLDSLSIPAGFQQRMNEIERAYAFTSFEPDTIVHLIRFVEREFPGDWVRFIREAARSISLGDDPARTQIAIAQGEIVGFSHFDGGRFGPIGVAKGHEGNGIGSALMLSTLRAMRENGFDRAWFLWTDDRTAARFYAPWGWQEWRRFSIVSKAL